jgi:hypothetical protein
MLVQRKRGFKYKSEGYSLKCDLMVFMSKGVVVVVANQPGDNNENSNLLQNRLNVIRSMQNMEINTNYMYIRIPASEVAPEYVYEIMSEGKVRRVGAIEMVEEYFGIEVPDWN